MNDHPIPYHVIYLRAELEKRKQKNPRYSMRAFAHSLDIHPSAMCRILAGNQPLTTRTCLMTLQRLTMSDEEKIKFIGSVAEEKMLRTMKTLSHAIGAGDPVEAMPTFGGT